MTCNLVSRAPARPSTAPGSSYRTLGKGFIVIKEVYDRLNKILISTQVFGSGVKDWTVRATCYAMLSALLTFFSARPGSCLSSGQTCQTPLPLLQDRCLQMMSQLKEKVKPSSILLSKFRQIFCNYLYRKQ